jgi:hypothetical protein
MESVKNNLPTETILFFKSLSNYLHTKLYFFGSVQRIDYFHGSSDIDVDIFSYNPESTIIKLKHFLGVDKIVVERFVWRLNCNNRVVKGCKIDYKNLEENINAEFSVFNEKDKDGVLCEHNNKIHAVPLYIIIITIILKILYYNLNLMNKETFSYFKKKVWTLSYIKDDYVSL